MFSISPCASTLSVCVFLTFRVQRWRSAITHFSSLSLSLSLVLDLLVARPDTLLKSKAVEELGGGPKRADLQRAISKGVEKVAARCEVFTTTWKMCYGHDTNVVSLKYRRREAGFFSLILFPVGHFKVFHFVIAQAVHIASMGSMACADSH